MLLAIEMPEWKTSNAGRLNYIKHTGKESCFDKEGCCVAAVLLYCSHAIYYKTRSVHECKSTFLCKSSITDS